MEARVPVCDKCSGFLFQAPATEFKLTERMKTELNALPVSIPIQESQTIFEEMGFEPEKYLLDVVWIQVDDHTPICNHKFHRSCVLQYLVTKVIEGNVKKLITLKCPATRSCQGIFSSIRHLKSSSYQDWNLITKKIKTPIDEDCKFCLQRMLMQADNTEMKLQSALTEIRNNKKSLEAMVKGLFPSSELVQLPEVCLQNLRSRELANQTFWGRSGIRSTKMPKVFDGTTTSKVDQVERTGQPQKRKPRTKAVPKSKPLLPKKRTRKVKQTIGEQTKPVETARNQEATTALPMQMHPIDVEANKAVTASSLWMQQEQVQDTSDPSTAKSAVHTGPEADALPAATLFSQDQPGCSKNSVISPSLWVPAAAAGLAIYEEISSAEEQDNDEVLIKAAATATKPEDLVMNEKNHLAPELARNSDEVETVQLSDGSDSEKEPPKKKPIYTSSSSSSLSSTSSSSSSSSSEESVKSRKRKRNQKGKNMATKAPKATSRKKVKKYVPKPPKQRIAKSSSEEEGTKKDPTYHPTK